MHVIKYPHYLPTWNEGEKFPPLEDFDYYEHGKYADPGFPDLLGPDIHRTDLSPLMGSEVSGIQLSSLHAPGRDQLALFVAQRKVVVFRNQDFADLPIPEALNFGRYFGRLNIHPTTGSPEGYPEVHLAHRGADDQTMNRIFSARTNSITWHSDTTFERQPAGLTLMYILDLPDSGGDTIFSNNVEAYQRLSLPFRQRLHGLEAVHSGLKLAESSRQREGIVRKEPVVSTHPIVRTHPATGEKALFVNPHCESQLSFQSTLWLISLDVGGIVGYKQEESDALLGFLFEHIAGSLDCHVRVKWAEKSVVVWDVREKHKSLAPRLFIL